MMTEYNDVLNELQDYMLDEVNMQKSLRIKLVNDKSNIKKQNEIKNHDNIKKKTLFIPKEQDSLFWCYFIIKNGEINYETTNNKNLLLTKQLKIDLVSVIRKNKDIVKMYKFDTITNIESNLANDNNININTFLTLCAINNINIIYVCKKTYYELLMNDSNQIYIVHEVDSLNKYYNKYGFELASEVSLNTIKENLYKIDKIGKPIKGLSCYKVEELIDICNKLAIETINKDTGKRKQKKDLYELIIQYF
jgi:hypothetical protein